ncbi:hypothetical protein JTB14_013351 [Gonioctena quinquepunctata]|nr:hypothetical protein JTB14_013351 [Gonioctena quinquepunctata]
MQKHTRNDIYVDEFCAHSTKENKTRDTSYYSFVPSQDILLRENETVWNKKEKLRVDGLVETCAFSSEVLGVVIGIGNPRTMGATDLRMDKAKEVGIANIKGTPVARKTSKNPEQRDKTRKKGNQEKRTGPVPSHSPLNLAKRIKSYPNCIGEHLQGNKLQIQVVSTKEFREKHRKIVNLRVTPIPRRKNQSQKGERGHVNNATKCRLPVTLYRS